MKIFFTIIFAILILDGNTQADTVFIRKNISDTETPKYANDTVIFESFVGRNMLIGSKMLPTTFNQLACRRFGLFADRIESSQCNKEMEHFEILNKMGSIVKTDSTLTIDIQISSNCCFSFLGDIAVVEDSILKLIHIDYGESHCACECCFGLKYYLGIGWYSDDHEYKKVRYVMINDDRKTITKFK